MRIAACVVGVVGALVGIYFAQLLVTVSMVLSLATSQTGDIELGSEFFLGAGALLFFALGMAGAIITPIRATVGALLLLISAVGSVVSILLIGGPGPTAITNGATAAAIVPYVGSALLFVATVLAAIEAYEGMMVPALPPAASASGMTPVTPAAPVVPTRSTLAAAVPMKLLSAPNASAPSKGTLEPGSAIESLEQIGEFVHVRGDGFEGYLPAWAIRRG
jgi:hypothetical protein